MMETIREIMATIKANVAIKRGVERGDIQEWK